MKIAFIGLGVMGFPMSGHLSSAGHDLRVFNRTHEKSQKWLEKFKGKVCRSVNEACEDVDLAMCCVGDDPDIEEVVMGVGGILSSLKSGSIIVDHTTASRQIAGSIYERAKQQGIGFLDAPVSGGEIGAQHGTLTIMCGGEESAFGRVEPILNTYAKTVRLMGPAGSGQLTKMVNQICIAGLIQSLAEALEFGRKSGLDMNAVIDVISGGAAQSWQMDNRANTMIDGKFEFGFAVDWMRKDLRICMAQAERSNADIPVAKLVDQYYSDVQRMGGGRWDTSSLMYRQSSRVKTDKK